MSFAFLQVTGAVGWRKDNIKYKKNEVFLDIVEQVNVLMSNKGVVLRSDVNGKVVMKVFLSGMPDVRLGLNDKLEVGVSGHQPRCFATLVLQACCRPACSVNDMWSAKLAGC